MKNKAIHHLTKSTGQCAVKRSLLREARVAGLGLASLSRRMVLPAVMLGGAAFSHAQLTTADILGTVTDATGAVIPNANLTLVNVDTKETRTATSNASGDFQFTLLPVGRYVVTTKASGFKTEITTALSVEAGDRARSDIKLQTGGESETVTVESQTPLLQADNATVSSTITAVAVQDLPLNGRNFVQLVQIVPGANEGPGNGLSSGGRPDDRRASSGFSVNGQDDTLNNFTIDGIDDNERIIGTAGVKPVVEAIQEITVQTNSYSPEAGRTAGGVVSIITRTGGNNFHGSAYEFFRNDITDAKNVLQTTGRKPELRQNQFGGSFGGPIFKDRTFFFADYEGLRLVSGLTYTSTVPTIDEYDAINSLAGLTPQTLLAKGNNHGFVDTQANNVGGVDPAALAYLKLFPAPNAGVAGQLTNNYVISPNKTQSSNSFDGRVDHHFNANNIFFGRYDYNKVTTFTPAALGTQGGLQISGGRYIFAGPATDTAQQYGFGLTHIFTQNLAIDLRAAYTRINNLSEPLNFGTTPDTQFGIANLNFNANSSYLAPIQFGPFSDVGDGAYVPLQDIDSTFQYLANVSYTKGNHNIKFGASYIRRQARNLQSAFAAGQFGFGLNSDTVSGNNKQSQDNNLASSLVGAYNFVNRNYDLATPDYRTYEPSFFVQDSWKVTPKLTVLYGGRYDVFTPFTEAHSHISNFNYLQAFGLTTATIGNALQVANVNGVDGHAGIKTDYSNFAPRVGFSASLSPQTVLRGGYGLSFFPGNYTSNADLKNAPFTSVYSPNCQSTLAVQIETANGSLAGQNPSCASLNLPSTFDAGIPLPVAQNINSSALSFTAEAPNFRSALIQQFNLQVEQQFGANVFTIGYVGNIGQHLPETINDINVPKPFNPNTNPTASARPLSRILPNLGGVGYLQSEGVSNYSALQTSFQRRLTKGLAFDANYTFAKALSDITGFSAEGGGRSWGNADPTRIGQLEYGAAENDINNRFAISLNYDLQYGKNFTGLKKRVLSGYHFNTIGVWQSGKPFDVVNGGSGVDALNGSFSNRATPQNNGGPDRPNQLFDARLGHPSVGNGAFYFNPNAFAPQPLGTIGNTQRDALFGPHFRHFDMSVFKDVAVTERVNLQFRAEAFNVSNTPSYIILDGSGSVQLGNSAFGTIQNYDTNYAPRIFQFALKALF